MRRADSATWKPLIFILLMVWLGACSGTDSTPEPPTPLPPSSPTPRLPFDVELVLWHPYTDSTLDGLQTVTDAFNANQEEVTVTLEYHPSDTFLTDYNQAVRRGMGPDVFVGDYQWIASLAESQLIYPLDVAFRSYVEDSVAYSLVAGLQYQSILWGVPLMGDTLVLYTNGVAAPTTFEALLEQPIAIDPAGRLALYIGPLPFMVDVDGSDAFLRLNFTSYLRAYRRVVQDDNVEFAPDATPFLNHEVNYYVGYASQYPVLSNKLSEGLQVARLPDGWRPLVRVVPLLISANATDTSIKAATRFFAYAISAEAQQAFVDASGRMPPLVSRRGGVEQVMTGMLEYSQAPSTYPLFYETVLPLLDVYLERALTEDVELLADEFFAEIR